MTYKIIWMSWEARAKMTRFDNLKKISRPPTNKNKLNSRQWKNLNEKWKKK